MSPGGRFPRAQDKLEDARNHLKQMREARDGATFRACFNAFLQAARAITLALQKDGSKVTDFEKWYETKPPEMKQDELLRFLNEARTEDFHEGIHRLEFQTFVPGPLSVRADIPPAPAPNAELVGTSDGLFWILDRGTPRQRRIPVHGMRSRVFVSVANPPRTHRGRQLSTSNPVEISEIALRYYAELVFEAESKF